MFLYQIDATEIVTRNVKELRDGVNILDSVSEMYYAAVLFEAIDIEC